MTAKTLLLGLFLACAPAVAGEAVPKYAEIPASPLTELPSKTWPGRQLLQADQQGRVFLLRDDTLDLYQLSATHQLVPKGRLVKEDDSSIQRRLTFDAAMSLTGDAWVLFSSPNHLYVIQGGRLHALEAPWSVSALAADGGEPLVAVFPTEIASANPDILHLDAPPFLQQWDGKRWNTLAVGRFDGVPQEGVTWSEHMKGEFSVFLALAPDHHLWIADQFAYRLRRFSPSAKLEDELSAGTGRVTWSERTEKEWKDLEDVSKKNGFAFSRRHLSPVRAEEVIRALALGHDGYLYLLVRTQEGLALDRFHPALVTLDRVLLKGVEVPGRVMMAGGQQGLYISAWSASNGVWHIDSETLAKAGWKAVPDAVLNGQPLSPPEPRETAPVENKPAARTESQGSPDPTWQPAGTFARRPGRPVQHPHQ
jgi:hypothetical protein